MIADDPFRVMAFFTACCVELAILNCKNTLLAVEPVRYSRDL